MGFRNPIVVRLSIPFLIHRFREFVLKLSTLLLCQRGNLAHWSKDASHESQAYRDQQAARLRRDRRQSPEATRARIIASMAATWPEARMIKHRVGRCSITTQPN
jgi:hypothetical protein